MDASFHLGRPFRITHPKESRAWVQTSRTWKGENACVVKAASVFLSHGRSREEGALLAREQRLKRWFAGRSPHLRPRRSHLHFPCANSVHSHRVFKVGTLSVCVTHERMDSKVKRQPKVAQIWDLNARWFQSQLLATFFFFFPNAISPFSIG